MTSVDAGQIVSTVMAGIGGVLKSLPKSQLAKVGLTRGSMSGVTPIAGAFVGGALVAAFAIPSSRRWILTKSKAALDTVVELTKRNKEATDEDDGSNDVERPAPSASAVRDVSNQPS